MWFLTLRFKFCLKLNKQEEFIFYDNGWNADFSDFDFNFYAEILFVYSIKIPL